MPCGRGTAWIGALVCSLLLFSTAVGRADAACSTITGAPACVVSADTYMSQEAGACLAYLSTCTTSIDIAPAVSPRPQLFIDGTAPVNLPAATISPTVNLDAEYSSSLTIQATTMECFKVITSGSSTAVDCACTGLYFPNLVTMSEFEMSNFRLPYVSTLDFPSLQTAGCVQLYGFNISSLSFPALTTLQGLDVSDCPNLVTFDFAHSLSSGIPLRPVDLKFGTLPALQSLDLTALNSSEISLALTNVNTLQLLDLRQLPGMSLLTINGASMLTSVLLSSLVAVHSIKIDHVPSLTTLNLSSLATVQNVLSIDTGALTSLSLPQLQSTCELAVISHEPLAAIDVPALQQVTTYVSWWGPSALPAQPPYTTYMGTQISWCNVSWATLYGNHTTLSSLGTMHCLSVTTIDYPNLRTINLIDLNCLGTTSIALPSLLYAGDFQFFGSPALHSISAPQSVVSGVWLQDDPVLSIFCVAGFNGSSARVSLVPRLPLAAIMALFAESSLVSDYQNICPVQGTGTSCGDDYTAANLCTEPTYSPIVQGGTGEGTLNGEPCPTGGVCPGGNKVYPKPGYWNYGTDSGFVAICEEPAEVRCKGGVNSTCGDGYGGTLCGVCAAGYYMRGTECVPCAADQKGAEAALYATAAVLFALFGACHVLLDDRRLDYVVTFFKWLQLLRVAGTKTGYNLPTGMKEINDNLALITFDYNFLRPGCDGSSIPADFSRVFWGNAVVLVCLISPPLLVLGPLAIFNKTRRTFWINRIFRTVIIYAILIFFVVATRAIQSCTCIKLGDVYVLRAYPNFPCQGGAVLGVGILALIVFIAYVPMQFTYTLVMLYRRDQLDNEEYRARFGYMYHHMRLDKARFIFEIVQMLHLLLMAVAWNVFPYNASPYAFAVATYSLLLITIAVWRPLLKPRSNALRVFTVGLGFISSVASLITLSALGNPAGTSIGVVVGMAAVVILLTAGVYLADRRLLSSGDPGKSDGLRGQQKLKAVDGASGSASGGGSDVGSDASSSSRSSSTKSSSSS